MSPKSPNHSDPQSTHVHINRQLRWIQRLLMDGARTTMATLGVKLIRQRLGVLYKWFIEVKLQEKH